MSDNWMIVLAKDPLARPTRECAEAAFALLSEMRPEACDPELHLLDAPELFDCGSNLDKVFCPSCGVDVTDWWWDAVGQWGDSDDKTILTTKTPCCDRETSLNDLDYVEPLGFACVALELMNPDSDLEPEELKRVEMALGLPLRIVWRHL